MEHNSNIDSLLISYLMNESDAAEKAFVLKWIGANERNREYFEQLKKTSRLIAVKQTFEHINVEHEWNNFQNEISRRKLHTPVLQLEPFPGTHFEGMEPKKKSKVTKLVISLAAAASIILIAGVAWLSFGIQQPVKQAASVHVSKVNAHVPVSRHEFNTSEKPRKIYLKDSSEVILEGRSGLSFLEPFHADRRDLTLIGKANFKVVKDKSRPFSVFSGDLKTTALGTNFTVTAYRNSGKITIRLFEGKVVVKSNELVKRKLKKDFYLLPGQELVYNTLNATASVHPFNIGKRVIVQQDNPVSEKSVVDNPSIPLYDKGSWYMFNNQSLSQVFNQLNVMYDAEIVYNKKDVQKLYFIGKFSKADSLESIINQIAELNNLTVTKINSKYIINKQ